MKQAILVTVVAFLFVTLLSSTEGYAQTRNVTFLVNSATVPDTTFPGYIMQVRGSVAPLTWGNDTGGQLDNIGGDYWSKTLAFPVGDTVAFKIFAGTDGWEQNLTDPYGLGGGNRFYIVADRDTTLPLQFFNNGVSGAPQYFRPWTAVPDSFINVYFRVNMLGANQVNRFGYVDSIDGDSVGVRGGGPGPDLNWAPTFYLTKEQPASNGGFSYAAKYFKSARLRINKNAVNEGDGIDFKFLIGSDWGRDELQGQPNRHFTIPIGKKDTTITWVNFDNIKASGRVNSDSLIVTYLTDMSRAIASGGFSIGDTLEVEQGHFGTINGPLKVKQMARQGLTTSYRVVDTILTSRNFLFDYQYYVNKNGVRTRENYYNFYYAGDVQAEAEKRQILTPLSGPMTVRDTAASITQARRRPDFPNARRLLRNVAVRWEVDMRPAYYQILIGHDTLNDIQGTFSITTPDQVFQYGPRINGLNTGSWQTWGAILEADTSRMMWDDGTHGDQVANDSIYTRVILASPDSLGIGTKSQVGQVFKFGIRGGDNEGGRGGFGNNHTENINDATNTFVISSQWGNINPAFYHNWDYDNHRPIFNTVTVSTGLSAGWNMISNPMTNPVPDDSAKHLFPTISSRVFGFNNGYIASDTMHNGTGYWGKFPAATTNVITGTALTRDSLTVALGWNMVGSISNPVDTSTIVSVPPGLKASNWFGWSGVGYAVVSQLAPGKAFWVKSSGAGKFVLANPLLRGRGKVQASGGVSLDGLNTLTITDSKGGSQTLYFGADAKNEIQLPLFEMPPAPPVGALDARFETASGGLMVQTHKAKVSEPIEFPVRIQSDAYPLTVAWKINIGAASYELADGVDGKEFRAKEMIGEGSIRVTSSSVNKVVVRLVGEGTLPVEYALSQNYPNPFNPTTNIKYALPVQSRVTIHIFNVLGQQVRTLVNDDIAAGYHIAEWDGTNSSGQQIASGTYFLQLSAQGTNGKSFNEIRKLMLLK